MQCGKVYITYIPDCDENEGGYYCQVYTDDTLAHEIDFFCIHPEECNCDDYEDVERFIKEYSEMYQTVHYDFITDIEKMRDFFEVTKEEFLFSYSYLDEEDYNLTSEKVKNMSADEIERIKALCRALPDDE